MSVSENITFNFTYILLKHVISITNTLLKGINYIYIKLLFFYTLGWAIALMHELQAEL